VTTHSIPQKLNATPMNREVHVVEGQESHCDDVLGDQVLNEC
jgi:hypothetical protein